MKRTVAIALLALGACNKEPEVKLKNATPEQVADAAKAAGAGAAGSETKLEPGQWQLITSMKVLHSEGLPDGARAQMKNMVERTASSFQCIKPEDVQKPNIFAGQNSGRCKYDSFEMKGGKINATMTCPGQAGGEMKMTMDGDYAPRSYNITATMDMATGGQSMKMQMKTQGNRIGECSAAPAKRG
jgi:hypothetical protein